MIRDEKFILFLREAEVRYRIRNLTSKEFENEIVDRMQYLF